nr:MAG TPA: hypothetical protein [Caudoviricetes sp.]
MSRDKYGHYVNDKGVEIKASTSSSGKDKIDIYDSCPAENEDHGSIHINFDSNSGTGTITDTTSDSTETTSIGCYLTTACMRHMQNKFDDNCYELTTLRWFRDNFVSKEDIELYYKKAPLIVEAIENTPNNNSVYNDIYENVIVPCVRAIENKEYASAYKRYKDNILSLEKKYIVSAV